MGALFTPEPEQWGLRGDPYLWQALRDTLETTSIPSTDQAVDSLLVDQIKDLTGVDLRNERQRRIHVADFAHGGMSSGEIDVLSWRARYLPLLIDRAADSRGSPHNQGIEVDPQATRRRIARLRRYVERHLLSDDRFLCAHFHQCRDSRRDGDAFREGIMSHVGRRFDLMLDGKPLRVVVVGQEAGLPKGAAAAAFGRMVSIDMRYRQTVSRAGLERRFYADDGVPGRNPHMRGTTTALRLLLGIGPGTDYEREFVRPENGHPFHLFDGFALVNRLLCSAGPPGGSQGRPTRLMAQNCSTHFAATLSILEPTIVILQGSKVARWSVGTLPPVRQRTDHLYEADLEGRRVVVCQFSHPSAHGSLRWGDRPDAPYVTEVVAPTLRDALQLSHDI